MDVNIFVVNSDSLSRNKDMDICLMIRGVQVYGCQCWQDALTLSTSVRPNIVLYKIQIGDDDCYHIIENVTSGENKPEVIVITPEEVSSEISGKYISVGATSFLAESNSKDGLLYLLKNYSDIINAGKDKEVVAPINNTSLHSFIVQATGYNDILSINRRFAAYEIKPNLDKNLVYIRLFSFIYDFLVKCFLRDHFITIGFVADKSCIGIIFPINDQVKSIMEESVFYSIAKPFIIEDVEFCKMYLDLKSDIFGNVIDINITYNKIIPLEDVNEIPLFTKTIDNVTFGFGNMAELYDVALFYSKYLEIFIYFAEYIKPYEPSIEMEFHRDTIIAAFAKIDESISKIYNLTSHNNLSVYKKDLYFAVLEAQILLYEYRRQP